MKLAPVTRAVKKKPEHTRPDYARSAQDRFLTQMAEERRKVVVFLTNGVKLEGEIKSYDEYAILLEGAMTDHVYKHAVSTIQPLTAVGSNANLNVADRHIPRGVVGEAAHTAKAAAGAASGAEGQAKEGSPRQPVIVIRAKRRTIKTTTRED